eukprot:scaffold64874_cov30-Phaeocystis_antarctica.AAC.1
MPPPSPPPPSPPPAPPPPPSYPWSCPNATNMTGFPLIPLDMGGFGNVDTPWCYRHNGNEVECESSMIYNVTDWTTSVTLIKEYGANPANVGVNPANLRKAGDVWWKGVQHDIGDRFRRCLYGLVAPGKCSMSEVDEFCNVQPPPPPTPPPSPY